MTDWEDTHRYQIVQAKASLERGFEPTVGDAHQTGHGFPTVTMWLEGYSYTMGVILGAYSELLAERNDKIDHLYEQLQVMSENHDPS